MHIIRTNPYRASYLTVAPDGAVWTAGYGIANGNLDGTQDSLRHFDASGKLVASAFPANSANLLRAKYGYLDFSQGRLIWYSPTNGAMRDRSIPAATVVEINPSDLTILNSYPGAPREWGDYVYGFAVTPNGRIFSQVYHSGDEAGLPTLYELDRGENKWVVSNGPINQAGYSSTLEGADAESLVFGDIFREASKQMLQVVDLSRTGRP